MFKIAIRADGSKRIGMGHIIRCLTVAEEFRKAGCIVCFFCRFREGIDKVRDTGFEVVELGNSLLKRAKGDDCEDKINTEEEVEELVHVFERVKFDLVIIDSYNVDKYYFFKLRPFARKLCYIDDVNKFIYPVDILINGNITAEYLKYTKYHDKEVLLLGIRYNLIRDEFRNLPKRAVNRDVQSVMITTGGADPYNMSTRLVRMLLGDVELKTLNINVLVGPGFENKNELKKISKEYENITLYENPALVSKVMLTSDIALSAGGSTLYELCTCGTPTLAFVMAGNQKSIVKFLSEKKYIEPLGWYSDFTSEVWTDKVKKLCTDFERRKDYCERMQKLADGKGAERVAREIMKTLEYTNN